MNLVKNFRRFGVPALQTVIAGAAGFYNEVISNVASLAGRKVGVILSTHVVANAPVVAGTAALVVAVKKVYDLVFPNNTKSTAFINDTLKFAGAFAVGFGGAAAAGFLPLTVEAAVITGTAAGAGLLAGKLVDAITLFAYQKIYVRNIIS